jgi:hypothetical protein
MSPRIDIAMANKPVRELLQDLEPLREPVELVIEGTVVAKLVPPTEMTDLEKQRILAEGWQAVKKARENAGGKAASEIQKEVDQAVREVRSRHDKRGR